MKADIYEPRQSYVPGLLLKFLEEKPEFQNPDKETSNTKKHKFTKEHYLSLHPQDQAQLFAEFYSGLEAEQQQQVMEGARRHAGVTITKINPPVSPKERDSESGWGSSISNWMGSIQSNVYSGLLAAGAFMGMLDSVAGDDPTRGSNAPSAPPTQVPTFFPTISPTFNPTVSPTSNPTFNPTLNPTEAPSVFSTAVQTIVQTVQNTFNQTINGTVAPTHAPTNESAPSGSDHYPKWEEQIRDWERNQPEIFYGVVVGVGLVLVAGCCAGYMCCAKQSQDRIAPAPNPRVPVSRNEVPLARDGIVAASREGNNRPAPRAQARQDVGNKRKPLEVSNLREDLETGQFNSEDRRSNQRPKTATFGDRNNQQRGPLVTRDNEDLHTQSHFHRNKVRAANSSGRGVGRGGRGGGRGSSDSLSNV